MMVLDLGPGEGGGGGGGRVSGSLYTIGPSDILILAISE